MKSIIVNRSWRELTRDVQNIFLRIPRDTIEHCIHRRGFLLPQSLSRVHTWRKDREGGRRGQIGKTGIGDIPESFSHFLSSVEKAVQLSLRYFWRKFKGQMPSMGETGPTHHKKRFQYWSQVINVQRTPSSGFPIHQFDIIVKNRVEIYKNWVVTQRPNNTRNFGSDKRPWCY